MKIISDRLLKAFFLLAISLLLSNFPLCAQDPSPSPKLTELSPGIFLYNGITLDKKAHSISFPAQVNQREGMIEYVLVNEKGKTHESLLSTKLLPHDIQAAMFLIGLNPADIPKPLDSPPPDAIDSAYLHSAPKIKGASVRIFVSWTEDGKKTQVPLEDWVFNLDKKAPMTEQAWTYNGSMIEDGQFLADQDLSLIAVITDPTALVNNPRDGYDNDEIWQARDDKTPPLDTAVQVTITLTQP